MKQVCIDDDFLVGDDISSLRCGRYDQVQFKSLQFRAGPKKNIRIEDTIFSKCSVLNGICSIGRFVSLEDVSFIDLAVKEMEISAGALLNNVIISGAKTKFLTIKRLYKDTALHEMEASAVTGIVDVSGFSGALEIFNFPVDRLKLNVESHFVVDFKMLDSIPWEDLGIVKVGGYWYQSISRLAKRESPEAVFSIPKSGPALDEFNVLRREKFF